VSATGVRKLWHRSKLHPDWIVSHHEEIEKVVCTEAFDESDAMLIEAAPDLLAALKILLGVDFEHIAKNAQADLDFIDFLSLLRQKANDAIKKATGEGS
jgi:hypothetical protein